MVVLECKMCGGNLDYTEGTRIVECPYCGVRQTLPSVDNEKKIRLFNHANKLRMSCDFDRAAAVYDSIISEFPEEAEGYWGMCLCEFGIEYVDDPATGKKKPTCHRASFDKMQNDPNFRSAVDYADMIAKRQYTAEAIEIDRINDEILSVSKNEAPYDIFICYKETDTNKQRTVDSLLAEKLYDALTEKGYKVFFARISLEDKAGMMYEPYIFAALNSAKVMLCVGTGYAFFHAVWVKNEWSRFLRLAAKDKNKVLIPCYKDCDPTVDLPPEFRPLQAQDLGKVGVESDLLRGIDKIFGKRGVAEGAHKNIVVNTTTGASTETYITRAKLALETGDFTAAQNFCENALNMDPENPDAYLGKLLIELRLRSSADLPKQLKEYTDSINYERAYRFGDQKRKDWLVFCANSVILNIGKQKMQTAKTSKDFQEAAAVFARIPGFQDADELKQKCNQLQEQALHAEGQAIKEKKYREALQSKEKADDTDQLLQTIELFKQIPDYKDSPAQIKNCAELAIEWTYEKIEETYSRIKYLKICNIFYNAEKVFFLGFLASLVLLIADRIEFIFNQQHILTCSTVVCLIGCILFAFCTGYSEAQSQSPIKEILSNLLVALFFIVTIPICLFTSYKDGIKDAYASIAVLEDEIRLLQNKHKTSITGNIKRLEKKAKKAQQTQTGPSIFAFLSALILLSAFTVTAFFMPVMSFNNADELAAQGKYAEAIALVEEIKSEQAIEKTRELITASQIELTNNLSVGDVFNFGIYRKEKTRKGSSLIERDWRVLDIVDGKALVIENRYIGKDETVAFNGTTWENSGIRAFLNGDFINKNFSAAQAEMIVLSEVPFDGNPYTETQSENDTTDKVFLLSIAEAERYFKDSKDRQFVVRSDKTKAANWWLRSPGKQSESDESVNRTSVAYYGDINWESGEENVCRAAMWIDLSDSKDTDSK